MNVVEGIGFGLFVAAWCVGLVSWFLAVTESIGMWRFWPQVFRAGICVLKETRSLPPPSATAAEFKTKGGKFKVVNPELCFFRWRMRMFSFDIHTPFPIKGTVRWVGDLATIEGRIPVFTTVFIGAWLAGWTVGGVMASFGHEGHIGGVAFLLFGWVFATGTCAFSVPFEIRRARRLLAELENHLLVSAGRTGAWSGPA